MSRSETDSVSLDEKIARIKKKNEMIIKRKQLIEKEIELAKKHNAMVDLNAPKIFDEDDRPTLYSDTISKSHREKSKGSNTSKVDYKPRNNTREDADWRAERNEIDRERIRRQRADSGWKREWDADKRVPDNEFHRDSSFDKRSHSKEIPQTRPSYYQSVSVERPELPPRQNQCRGDQSISIERSDLPAPRPNQCKGRGRPVVRADNQVTISGSNNQNFNITQNLRRTVSVEPQNLKQEKVPLRKRVSWDNENELIESPRISLKDNHLKNIKVKVNTADTSVRNRSIEITEAQGRLDKSRSLSKFDDKTSLNIKDCVSKAAPRKSRVNQYAIKDTTLPKPKESSTVKIESKAIVKDDNRFTKPIPNVALCIPAAGPPPNDKVDADDDEWEDLSGEDWESASDEE